MRIIPLILALFASLFAKDLVPSKTHAVLNISYTNFQDVPQTHKKLVFVGQKNPNRKITVKTDEYGEVSFLIPKEDTYDIMCESLTGPFKCGESPYVSIKASTGGLSVVFDDTRAELAGVTFKAGSAELVESSLYTLNEAIKGLKINPDYIQEAISNGQLSSQAQRSFVEGKVYLWQRSVMNDYGYSPGIQSYINSQTTKLPWWMTQGL